MAWARVMRGISSMAKAAILRALSTSMKSPSAQGSSMPMSSAFSFMARSVAVSGRRTERTIVAFSTVLSASGAMTAPACSYSASAMKERAPASRCTATSKPSFT